RESNCIAKASVSCGPRSNTTWPNCKPKNNAHVTLDSSNELKLNTMPAPTEQHWKTATGWLYRVRMTNASQALTRSATSTGYATQLSDKPTSTSLPTRP